MTSVHRILPGSQPPPPALDTQPLEGSESFEAPPAPLQLPGQLHAEPAERFGLVYHKQTQVLWYNRTNLCRTVSGFLQSLSLNLCWFQHLEPARTMAGDETPFHLGTQWLRSSRYLALPCPGAPRDANECYTSQASEGLAVSTPSASPGCPGYLGVLQIVSCLKLEPHRSDRGLGSWPNLFAAR